MSRIEEKLQELGITIPEAAAPVANYVGWVRSGNLVITAGQIPLQDGEVRFTGKVGADISIEDAARAAQLCAINCIAQARAALDGDLDRVRRVVKLTGFVNAATDFADHPRVINGASDFMVAVFGDAGRHARSAVGAGSLPLNVAVEVEAIFEVE